MLRKEKGFTLIELLIVVAIIGIIAAIAVPNLLTAIQRSKQKRTMADLRAVGTALGSYQVDYNEFPTAGTGSFTAAALPAGYFNGATRDGWGNQTFYATDGNSYTYSSGGKNGGATGQAYVAGEAGWDLDVAFANGQMISPTN